MEPTERSMPPRNNYGRQGERQQAQFHPQAHDFESICAGEKIGAGDGEKGDFDQDQDG